MLFSKVPSDSRIADPTTSQPHGCRCSFMAVSRPWVVPLQPLTPRHWESGHVRLTYESSDAVYCSRDANDSRRCWADA